MRRWLAFFFCIAAWLFVAACGQTDLVVGSLGAGGGGSTCTPDERECVDGGECCSAQCAGGRCVSLSSACSTSGNPCSASEECCSGWCADGRCDAGSSYCRQTDDVCFSDVDCCSVSCLIVGDGPSGVCAAPPTGPSNCQRGTAGALCDGCNDCCSRLCAPYGESGVRICQEAQGCRQTGELCASDEECCGGDVDSGLPGAGNVTCQIDVGARLGVCRNALSCSPQGNVCHFQNYACGVSAASNKCCAEDGQEGQCALDPQGLPRCDGLAVCRAVGQSCATTSDCCAGRCLPGSDGRLVCAEAPAAECASEGAACSATSECCPGSECGRQVESTWGQCALSERRCSLAGQVCGSDEPCCGGLPCAEGRCLGIGAP